MFCICNLQYFLMTAVMGYYFAIVQPYPLIRVEF